MAQCCTGQTECNRYVTIGYLKTFVGNLILDSGGNVVHVPNTFDDDYIPTYDELTDESILPNCVDAGAGHGASNVDGIRIANASSYERDSLVKQEDLVLEYTRYKSFSISPSTISFDACSNSQDMGYSFKLTKTTKGHSGACSTGTTSSEVTDSGMTVSYSTGGSWVSISGNRISAGKNGSRESSQRTDTITGRTSYKGTSYSSTASLTQAGLTGSYSVRKGKYYTSVDITYGSTYITTCSSTVVSATAKANYYERYMWKDSCNYTYDSSPYDDRYSSENLESQSYTFPEVDCPTTSQTDTKEFTFTSDEGTDGVRKSNSVTFTRVCSQSCQSCENSTDWGEVSYIHPSTVGKCENTVTVSGYVPYTSHTRSWVGGECVDTTGTGTTYKTKSVTVPENTAQSETAVTGVAYCDDGGRIRYSIPQEAGPCGGCNLTSTTYSNITIPCDSASSLTTGVTYTEHYSNCADKQSTSSITLTNIECNSGTQREIFAGQYPFHVYQNGGCDCYTPPTCEECTCYKMGNATGTANWNDIYATVSWTYTAYTTNSDCIVTQSSTGSSSNSVTINANDQCDSTTKSDSFTWSNHKACDASNKCTSNNATINWSVTQGGNPSQCYTCDASLSPGSLTWDADSTTNKTITVNDGTYAATNISVSRISGDNHFTANVNSKTITVTPNGVNSGSNPLSDTFRVTYYSNGHECNNLTFTATQQGTENTCAPIGTAGVGLHLPYSGGSQLTVGYVTINDDYGHFSDVSNLGTVTFSSNHLTNGSLVYYDSTQLKIVADVKPNTSCAIKDDCNCTISNIKWYNNSDEQKICTEQTYTGFSQYYNTECDINDFYLSTTALTWDKGENEEKAVYFSAGTCISIDSTEDTTSFWVGSAIITDQTVVGGALYLTGYIYIEPRNVYTGTTQDLVEQAIISYESCRGSVTASSKTITLTMKKADAPCECNSFAITNEPYLTTCYSNAGGNGVTIASFSGLCGSITSFSSTDDFVSSISQSGNDIIANISANCGAERTATITVNYSASGSCTAKTFKVKQCSGSISIFPSNKTATDCQGGTETFTIQ